MQKLNSVNIRPGVTILSVLKHLNYKPYYALAEFVDNSIDSYLKNELLLKSTFGDRFIFNVNIDFDTVNRRITITDNAAGIQESDFPRAFRAAQIPPDNTSLSEFGMGMKSAACWFSNSWEVRTTVIGEEVERTIAFDINKIVKDEISELNIQLNRASKNSHYTVITLFDIENKMPTGRGMSKVKRHLASIYRDFIRRDILKLTINKEEELTFKTPKILNTPYFETPSTEPLEWKQDVEFDFGNDGSGSKISVKGFVAIMEKMSVSDSGFALFRRGRVIEGSSDNDEGFRPPKLSGSVGSHRYKRLFGEFHLEGFQVSHTKDGFQWDDNMDTFLELLKEELEHPNSIPILKQADKYRVKESAKNYGRVSKKVVDNTTQVINNGLIQDIEEVRNRPRQEATETLLEEAKDSYYKQFELSLNDCEWLVHLEVSYDESIKELFQVGDHLVPSEEKQKRFRNIGVRLSLVHPFMVHFAGDDAVVIEPILRIAVAFGLSEIIAKETGSMIVEVRNNMNELLSGSLSKP